MPRRTPPAREVKTAKTVFGIVEALNEHDGATVTELSDELGLAKSTVSDHLATLLGLGYLVEEGDRYHVGLRFLGHGNTARKRLSVRAAAQEPLERLADITGESAWLVVEEHDKAVFVDKELGDQAVQTMGEIGRRSSLHTTAAGKAILAHLPDDRQRAIIDDGELRPRTDHSITDATSLREELATIRDVGLAFNYQESNPGVNAVAEPIIIDGAVKGAIAVSGPMSRLSEEYLEGSVSEELRNTVNIVELNVRHERY